MKTKLLTLAVGISIAAALPVLAAEEHVVPTAPKDYLAMKNPLTDKKEVVEKGEKIYEKKCKKCHGEKGDGKGSGADKLETKPAVFIKPGYLKGRADGQLFFIADKGSKDTDMDPFGPGSDANLSKDDLWSVITYIRKAFTK
ncbi:MAG: c-type cytochrome [Nitrosomonadales bacterium]|nr:c-type cytochrome [Nitrosomonadales bacterium]